MVCSRASLACSAKHRNYENVFQLNDEGGFKMLVKIEDSFYLNTQHIIALQVSKKPANDLFEISIQYTPYSAHQAAEHKKVFASQQDAERFLNELNQKMR